MPNFFGANWLFFSTLDLDPTRTPMISGQHGAILGGDPTCWLAGSRHWGGRTPRGRIRRAGLADYHAQAGPPRPRQRRLVDSDRDAHIMVEMRVQHSHSALPPKKEYPRMVRGRAGRAPPNARAGPAECGSRPGEPKAGAGLRDAPRGEVKFLAKWEAGTARGIRAQRREMMTGGG
jgi:hypothetical protein